MRGPASFSTNDESGLLVNGFDTPPVLMMPHMVSGHRFRNTELNTVRNGKLVATEVYFGWNLPHKVAKGEHSA